MIRPSLFQPAHRPVDPLRRPALRRTAPALLSLALLTLPVLSASAQPIETRPLDPDFELAFDGVAGTAPGHGFVAAWGRGAIESVAGGTLIVGADRVMAVWLGPDGQPLTPIRALDQPDDEIDLALAVASATAGEAVVALGTTAGIETRRFRFDGSPPEALHVVSPCPTRADTTELVAAGDGYWIVWYELCDGLRIFARRLDRAGAPQGPAIEIAGPAERPRRRFGAAATPGGGFWVAWNQLAPGSETAGRAVMARRFGPDGTPATGAVLLRSAIPKRIEDGADLATLPDGGALVSWEDRTDRIFLRAIGANGVPAGPATPASGEPAFREFWPQVATSALGISAATWLRITPGTSPNQCVLRLFATDNPEIGEESELDSTCSYDDELLFGAGGSLLVLSHEIRPVPNGSFVNPGYSFPRIVVLPAAQVAQPPGPGFVPDAAPAFRYWVRIGGDEPEPRLGRPEPVCLPETACVSGAIPGRSEVFVRMVGPKPNGYLWPTIVRFTTSTVEVWIEQTATGTLRYYHLDGAEPGSDDLTGGFDRMGFMP